MSLRDRLRPAPTPTADPDAEIRAVRALATHRGRASIAAAPRAGKAAAALLRPLLPKGASMGLNELKRRWAEVAGAPFADKTAPEKLVGSVLTLRVPGALAPFLQQQAPLLLERLRLAGVQVKELRIDQRALPSAPKAPNVRRLKAELTPIEEAALTQRFDTVDDPVLRAALVRLGRAVKRA